LDGHDYSPVAYFVGKAHQAECEGASMRPVANKIGGQCLTGDQYHRTSNTYKNHNTQTRQKRQLTRLIIIAGM